MITKCERATHLTKKTPMRSGKTVATNRNTWNVILKVFPYL